MKSCSGNRRMAGSAPVALTAVLQTVAKTVLENIKEGAKVRDLFLLINEKPELKHAFQRPVMRESGVIPIFKIACSKKIEQIEKGATAKKKAKQSRATSSGSSKSQQGTPSSSKQAKQQSQQIKNGATAKKKAIQSRATSSSSNSSETSTPRINSTSSLPPGEREQRIHNRTPSSKNPLRIRRRTEKVLQNGTAPSTQASEESEVVTASGRRSKLSEKAKQERLIIKKRS